ncbi:MAG TPA: CheR family methyltransferase [Acidobacteriota bacterium]
MLTRFTWTILVVGCMLAATQGKRFIAYSDLQPEARRLLAERGITGEEFHAFLYSIEKETAARLREGEYDHLIYFVLQSSQFTRRPRIEPALSALQFVQSLSQDERTRYLAGAGVSAPAAKVPTAVKERMQDFRRALEQADGDERVDWFRKSLTAQERTLDHLCNEYVRAMRFLYRKEFGGKQESSLYQERGHSSDTRIESSYAVWVALSVIRKIDPPVRMNRVLIVGPGVDFAPRTDLIDSYPPQSYQPWAVADALLASGLASRDRLRIQCVDINDRVLDFFREFPKRHERRLTLLRRWDDPEFVEYFRNLGRQIGTERAVRGGKSLLLSQDAAQWITADKLNIVTERYVPPAPYDLVVVSNVFVYFDNQQLLLALSNIHSMLAEGGYLVHNELRPEVEEFSRALGFAPLQARTLRLSEGNVRPLFDSFVINQKRSQRRQ